MDIQRIQEAELFKSLKLQKVTLLLGACRVGKSMLIESFLRNYKRPLLCFNGEEKDTHQLLAQRSVSNYTRVLNGRDLWVKDTARNIPDFGKKLKLIVDFFRGLKILIAGSSVFVQYKVSAYSNTLRKEISKSQRWYFIDNGIRNFIVNYLEPMALKRDTERGMLWENYLFKECLKHNTYLKHNPHFFLTDLRPTRNRYART